MFAEIFTEEFKHAYAAHRVRYQMFGDTIPVASLQHTPEQFLSPLEGDLHEQHEQLLGIIKEHANLIESAFPYTIAVREDGDLLAQDGHKIEEMWLHKSYYCRGMYVRLKGPHEGTIILQMDDGLSRSLFDRDKTPDKSDFFNTLLQGMLLIPWTRGSQSDKGSSCTVFSQGTIYDSKIIIADTYLAPIKSYDLYGLRYSRIGDDGSYLHPNIYNPLYQIEKS